MSVGRPPIVSLVGRSGVGKTTSLERILRELTGRGVRVGTIKHDVHRFDIDRPGKDSWRHAEAGSSAVVISGPRRMALIRNVETELGLDEIVDLMGDLDLVLTEGYKRGDKPKIEVTRRACGTELLCSAEELLAVMTDYPVNTPVPQFALEDAVGVVDLLVERYLSARKETAK